MFRERGSTSVILFSKGMYRHAARKTEEGITENGGRNKIKWRGGRTDAKNHTMDQKTEGRRQRERVSEVKSPFSDLP